VRYAHAMPFGAEVRADGRVRFRLWAPAATQVELVLYPPDDRAASKPLPLDTTATLAVVSKRRRLMCIQVAG